MVILANIIAYLYILTVIGLFVVIGCIAAAGFQFYGEFKRVKAMAQGPKNAGMQIFNLGKGIALRDVAHVLAIGATGREAFLTVMATKDDLLGSAKAVNVGDAKEAATNAREAIGSIFSTATMGLQFARQFIDIISQVRQSEGGTEDV